jgi:Tfp pilus tip-associated adhesin PilY1
VERRAHPALDEASYDTGRRIVTMKKDAEDPVPLASLDSTQQSPLGDSTKGPKVLNYIRGDTANYDPSGEKYRPRAHVLGDIIHSRPLFVDHSTDPRVYVGANDGMLHAFDADSGDEVFAYIPSFFISPVATSNFTHIKALTVNPYVHNYYVDASPNAAKVTISGASKTILVGASARAARACTRSTSPTPLHRRSRRRRARSCGRSRRRPSTTRTSTAYSELGYTYGIPVIAKVSDGTWAAIVGNGYNNQGANQAVLYVINLATGAKIAAISTTSPQAVRTRALTACPVRPRSIRTTTARSTTSTLGTSTGTSGNSISCNIGSPSSLQALHDEPGAGDHRPARRSRLHSARGPDGHLRHRPDVHEPPTRPIRTTVYYA